MSTLKELIGDKTRGDGRKFMFEGWDELEWFEPCFKLGPWWYGILQDSNGGETASRSFNEDFSGLTEWHPPKKKKTITLYSPVVQRDADKYLSGQVWHSDKQYFCSSSKIVAWEERTIEVDE